jgi:lipopolysaccharide export system protein LptC
MGAPDRARRFKVAMRHSRRVRILRIAIPAVVVLGLIAITLSTYLNPLRLISRLPTELGNLVISGTKIKMEHPRLAGYTRDSRGYELTAQAAAQDLKKPEIVELEELRAKVDLKENHRVELSASSGVYDTKGELLTLKRNIVLTSAAYKALLSEAAIDIRKGHIVSERPVEVTMPTGTLNANRLEIFESGDVVRFEGGVTMNLKPEAIQPTTGAASQ